MMGGATARIDILNSLVRYFSPLRSSTKVKNNNIAEDQLKPVIDAINLTKDYGENRGLFNLNLSIFEGEIFGLIGPNGSGKSTFIRLIMDLIRPTSGSVDIFGASVTSHPRWVMDLIGYIPGELPRFPGLTGKYIIEELAGLRSHVDFNYVNELSEKLQLDLGVKFDELSHGNKQKVMLIQAFMHKPQLLVLDEPTLGLDPIIQREFMQLISDARDKGAAIVLSSHVLADVEKICDRIGLIFNGNLVKVGTLSELRESKVHDIEIVFSNNFDTSKLTDLANVQRVDQDGRTVRARIMGPISPILRILNQEEILELDSRELSLEEVFFSEFTR
jgi:ABC-2 type transport system ATP-binding protein